MAKSIVYTFVKNKGAVKAADVPKGVFSKTNKMPHISGGHNLSDLSTGHNKNP